MLKLERLVRGGEADGAAPALTLELPFHSRSKSRLRVTLSDGRDAGVFLPRGTVVRGGDRLLSRDGEQVQVIAARERLSRVSAKDPLAFARACYHLGNRHVPLEIGAGFACYLRDPVLDQMARGLGVLVEEAVLPFEPEAGAYAAPGHSHSAGHSHSHSHSHSAGTSRDGARSHDEAQHDD
ncbi:MAG: urease accessory protein UreE [Myxococcales bacterium]|nr:urease accessory protein UreE [Myxococcales bacterium]